MYLVFFEDIFIPPFSVFYYIILVHFFIIYPKRDDEIVMLRKGIEDLKANLQKYEDKQSAKQDASKQNSTKKSIFGRKK